MTPAARFTNSGEHYGSTPILARPGSQLTLYGSSSDLRHYHGSNSNYSLDRKLLSSSTSTSSSPALAMTSLTSLPLASSRKLVGYDSLENVRKPLTSGISHNNGNGNSSKSSSFRVLSGGDGGSLLDLTPSPSDSGVAELEAALRDRDSELAYLRQTMEHNEQVIFRVYQEKERLWERELRRMKTVHENRLRAGAQKALRLEQMLMMQTYQLQQDKNRLREEAERATREVGELRQEVDLLRGRLEETEWGLCQKTGELSLLKAQLKDSQGEQTTKGHELLHLRGQSRELKTELERHEAEATVLRRQMKERDEEIARLQRLIAELEETNLGSKRRQDDSDSEVLRLETEISRLKEQFVEVGSASKLKLAANELEVGKLRADMLQIEKELKVAQAVVKCSHGTCNPKTQQTEKVVARPDTELTESGTANTDESNLMNGDLCLMKEVDRLREELSEERNEFERERVTWAQEKEKVLRYQRQLQLNYVQMFRRTRTLETEVESLTLELELETKTGRSRNNHPGKKQLPAIDMSHTIEL
ncbi:Leucine zipper putative tumor suppressor 2-like protein [Zootermopsis nevadensis]|uniref:Leucine zipper putative tumor suppressor 2-like protein n=1 Tax=Zootermopsis nevadensis TaxID=136037 RepID=A0A067QII6_ZOONE|nr:Leucine zipper putative tumor suppressor 2-like protein [Zootermopsis nevadensis]